MAVVRRFRSGLLRPLGPHLAFARLSAINVHFRQEIPSLPSLSVYAAGGEEDHEWPVESVDLKANRYANAMSIDFVSPAGNVG